MAIVIGLSGGIATGKSVVSNYLRELGASIIDFDEVSKMVVEPELPAWRDIVDYFGKEILQEDGHINRDRLGAIVFDDAEKRAKLESFIHPRMAGEIPKQQQAAIDANPDALVIHDVPLLFELGGDQMMAKTIVVYASEGSQLNRMKARDGFSEEDARGRLKAQLPLSEKMRRADYVIYNDGSLDETKRQVQKLYSMLKEMAKGEQEKKWAPVVRHIEALLRLKTFPVAMKFLENAEELGQNKWVRQLDKQLSLCQLITLVRYFDWTVGATAKDVTPVCASVIGLAECPAEIRDGSYRTLQWVKTKEDGKKYEDSIPRIPTGRFQAVVLAPLVYDPFDPDMVLIYGNPAQMILIINAIQFEDYERLQFFCVGETSCSDAIAQCYLSGKPALAIPCYGERRFGHAQDDELVIALPPQTVKKVERNLQELYGRGIRYPIPFSGALQSLLTSMPAGYQKLASGEKIDDLGIKPGEITRW